MSGSVATWLATEGAHHDVVQWATTLGDDWARAYRECPRADWMLGIAYKRGTAHRDVVLAACACARFALEYVPDGEHRPARAIQLAERWARDGAEPEPSELEAVKRSSEAAVDDAPDPAVAAAATAALAALAALESAEHAALAAASAVQAAIMDAGECAVMSAMRYANDTCLAGVRDHVTSF